MPGGRSTTPHVRTDWRGDTNGPPHGEVLADPSFAPEFGRPAAYFASRKPELPA